MPHPRIKRSGPQIHRLSIFEATCSVVFLLPNLDENIFYGSNFVRAYVFVTLWDGDFDTPPLQLQHCCVVVLCSTEPVAQNLTRDIFLQNFWRRLSVTRTF